jgi:alpha/beta superfamily hydrolase
LIIDYEGQQYPFDMDDMDIRQALKIEKHIGGTMGDFTEGLTDTIRADCYQALGWLIFHAGDSTPIETVNFKFGKLSKAFAAAAAKEAAEEAAAKAAAGELPDPTATNGSGPIPLASSLSG